jgi:hypothetical protein
MWRARDARARSRGHARRPGSSARCPLPRCSQAATVAAAGRAAQAATAAAAGRGAAAARATPDTKHKCFNESNCFCPHCPQANGVGYEYLASKIIAPALTKLLPKSK